MLDLESFSEMMKKYILIIMIAALSLLLIGIVLKGLVFKKANAGLKIDSMPEAKVFIDGKEIGSTPFLSETLSEGEKTLRLVPQNSTSNLYPWETKIKLVGGVMTVINREFGSTEALAKGELITLEKISDSQTASLVISSTPDSAMVSVDGESKGFTPLNLEKIVEGDKEIVISASGYMERRIRTRLIAGFKTVISVKLAEDQTEIAPTPEPDLDLKPTPTGKVTPTPTPKVKVSPTPTPTITIKASPTPKPTINTNLTKPYVVIKETPTGWLRVRSEASTSASELGKANPGESYSLIGEQSGWYQISFNSQKGWISSQYADKVE